MPSDKDADRFDLQKKKNTKSILTFEVNKKGQINSLKEIIRIGLLRGSLEFKQFLRQRESVVFTLFFPVILFKYVTGIKLSTFNELFN